MPKLSHLLVLPLIAVAGSALASPSFSRDWSDTRTILQDYTGFEGANQGWSGRLTTDGGDSPLFLNSIAVSTGAGFDPNIVYDTPTELAYYDANLGADGTYQFGTAIDGGQNWDLRQFLRLDTSSGTTAALGTYDLTLSFLGGSDASATDTLATFDFHVDVADRLDATTTGTATPIGGPGDVSNVSISITNNGTRALETTTWYYINRGFQQDPNDGASPYLTGNFTGNWFEQAIAPGDTRTGAHSDWSLNGTSTVGTYIGTLGVSGGLHSGDDYSFRPNPVLTIGVQSVPEPASMAILGVGALGLLRRRRK